MPTTKLVSIKYNVHGIGMDGIHGYCWRVAPQLTKLFCCRNSTAVSVE